MDSATLEKTIANCWQNMLGVANVGLDENFFDLGGDSLAMIRFHHALQQTLGQSVPIVELFRAPTVRTLAHALNQNEDASASHRKLLAREGSNPFRSPPATTDAVSFEERAGRQRAARDRMRDCSPGTPRR